MPTYDQEQKIRQLAYDAVREAIVSGASRSDSASSYFPLLSEHLGPWNSFEAAVRAAGFSYPGKAVLDRAMRNVAHEMFADGLLVRGHMGQGGEWGMNTYAVTPTARGVQWAAGAHQIHTRPHDILASITAVGREFPHTVTPAVVALCDEAVRCIESRCFRASVVLIGVACEEAVDSLVESLIALRGFEQESGWSELNNLSAAFAVRWAGARRVLTSVKANLKRQLLRPYPEWWSAWDAAPDSLVPIGEAVRLARNTAAHEAAYMFAALESSTLFCGLPFQLRWIASLNRDLSAPPLGINVNRP